MLFNKREIETQIHLIDDDRLYLKQKLKEWAEKEDYNIKTEKQNFHFNNFSVPKYALPYLNKIYQKRAIKEYKQGLKLLGFNEIEDCKIIAFVEMLHRKSKP